VSIQQDNATHGSKVRQNSRAVGSVTRERSSSLLEQVAPEHWFALNKWLGASTADDLYARWAKWFLVERMKDKPLLFVP
jgi:hypothetical protein